MVTLMVAVGIFAVSSAYVFQFAVHAPPSAAGPLAQHDLAHAATEALGVLLGTPGYPATWGGSASSIENVTRLGLLTPGSSARVDPAKLDAFVRGHYNGASGTNGFVDYPEARTALGLAGLDYHLRTGPIISPTAGSFGLASDMASYRVAYVGNGSALASEATSERAQLAGLPIAFHDATPLTLGAVGDAYPDDITQLRALLLPQLGSRVTQSILAPGTGTPTDFRVVPAAAYATLVPAQPFPTSALALADATSTLGYAPARELRAVLGPVDLTSVAVTATVTWNERVDTSLDPNDYGILEASPDNGATWYALNDVTGQRSTDPGPLALTMAARTATITALTCAPCLGSSSVLLAFHWIADGNAITGRGWVVDDVKVTGASGNVLAWRTFEARAYDALIIGSDADQLALATSDARTVLADFVNVTGGRILVLGGQQSAAWLPPLYHSATRDANAALGTPDSTHPILNVPNALGWRGYATSGSWDFASSPEAPLFAGVLANVANQDQLAVTTLGAFGSKDAGLVLTTFKPATMPTNEAQRFFANTLLYGRYQGLYADIGPALPPDVPVSSATRSALVDTSGHGDYKQIGITLYVWAGMTDGTSVTGAPAGSTPTAPRSLTAGASAPVTLSWSAPTSSGASSLTNYRIYRGGAIGAETLLATIGTNTSFVDATVQVGHTYFYNVTAVNAYGPSSSTQDVQTTPLTTPGAPTSLVAVPGLGQISLSWTAPASGATGGSAVSGYRISRGTTSGAETLLATIGSNTSFVDAGLPNGATRYYTIAATAGGGTSAPSSEAFATTFSAPYAPGAPVVTPGLNQLTVSWSPPADGGLAISGYNLYASNASGSETLLARFGSGTLSTNEAGLANGQTRYYKVSANNSLGEGTLSPEGSGSTVTVSVPPTLLTATGGVASISLSWSAPASNGGTAITGYKIYAGALAGTETLLATIGTNTSYVDAGLGASQTRFYKVTATNAAGESLASNEATATTIGVPTAPLLPTAAGGSQNVSLSWSAPVSNGGSAITGYKIYSGATTGSETLLATIGTNTSFVDATLANNQTRYYKIAAVNAAGVGAYSTEVSATTNGVPWAPLALVATPGTGIGLGNGHITLNWTAPASNGGSAITLYSIYRGTSLGGEGATAIATTTSLSYDNTGLTSGAVYYYKVTATNSVGEGPASNEAFAIAHP